MKCTLPALDSEIFEVEVGKNVPVHTQEEKQTARNLFAALILTNTGNLLDCYVRTLLAAKRIPT